MGSRTPSEFYRASIAIIAAGCTATLFGPGPIIAGSAGVLLPAVGEHFGWSRTTFSVLPVITGLTSAVFAPLYGRLMDQIGTRRVLLRGIVGFAVALIWLAFVPSAAWLFFASYIVLGVMSASQGPTGFTKVICQWFVRSRGAVMSMMAAASVGVGYAVAPQVANYLVVHHSWRAAYLAFGLAVLFISFPISFLFLRERGNESVGAQTAERPPDEGVTQAEGLRSLSFWKIWISLFLAANIFYGLIVHLFPMLLDRGINRLIATSTLSVFALGALGGQIAAAFLLDRVNTPKVALVFLLVGLAGVLQIHHGTEPVQFAAGAIMIGVGQGAELTAVAYIVSRLFGLRSYGGLCGIIYGGAALATGTGPMLMGFCFDRFGSYGAALVAGEVGLTIAIILIFTLPPYRIGGKADSVENFS
jgi:MFS family permease